MHHAFKLGDREINLELSRTRDGYRLHLPERTLAVNLRDRVLSVDGQETSVSIAVLNDDVFIHLDGETYQLHYEHPLDRLAHQTHGATDDEVRAPMPGSLVAVRVKVGHAVTKGETLLVMESMKMETTLSAPRDGMVAAVHYAPAQAFDRGAVLLTLEPAKS